jgi:hypothetical protein
MPLRTGWVALSPHCFRCNALVNVHRTVWMYGNIPEFMQD